MDFVGVAQILTMLNEKFTWSPLVLELLTKTYFFCRAPINSILGFIIRTYQKVGFGRLR